MEHKQHIGIIVVAGGSGTRMGGQLPKQFMLLDGEPILGRTINRFAETLPGAEIVVVLPTDYIDFWNDYAKRFEVAPHRCAAGGATRFDSVRNGLAAISADCDLIAVQDGVRPLSSKKLILRAILTASAQGSAIPAIAPVDTLREVTRDGKSHPIDRSTLRMIQTPQVFRAEWLRSAYDKAPDNRFTDDASAVEAAGNAVTLIEGEATNLKITTRSDLAIADTILKRQADGGADL